MKKGTFHYSDFHTIEQMKADWSIVEETQWNTIVNEVRSKIPAMSEDELFLIWMPLKKSYLSGYVGKIKELKFLNKRTHEQLSGHHRHREEHRSLFQARKHRPASLSPLSDDFVSNRCECRTCASPCEALRGAKEQPCLFELMKTFVHKYSDWTLKAFFRALVDHPALSVPEPSDEAEFQLNEDTRRDWEKIREAVAAAGPGVTGGSKSNDLIVDLVPEKKLWNLLLALRKHRKTTPLCWDSSVLELQLDLKPLPLLDLPLPDQMIRYLIWEIGKRPSLHSMSRTVFSKTGMIPESPLQAQNAWAEMVFIMEAKFGYADEGEIIKTWIALRSAYLYGEADVGKWEMLLGYLDHMRHHHLGLGRSSRRENEGL
ncbi:hypothetical protein L596_023730 [Steinernema carpocapsae]|uniref:Uncharacterized protein n=1 Tax=Steinernema carpocapsae TaxID=34508 RepID=A0A4U5MFA6_STECR|nr:hypothetical protein L596_023730 [Steinernema carpocapsae]